MHLSSLPRPLLAAVLLVLCGSLFTACDRAKPPKPIAVGEIPAAVRTTFSAAKAETKEVVEAVATAVESKEWTRASIAVQALSESAGLSKKQRAEVARYVIAISGRVSEAAAAGDPQASELQTIRRINK